MHRSHLSFPSSPTLTYTITAKGREGGSGIQVFFRCLGNHHALVNVPLEGLLCHEQLWVLALGRCLVADPCGGREHTPSTNKESTYTCTCTCVHVYIVLLHVHVHVCVQIVIYSVHVHVHVLYIITHTCTCTLNMNVHEERLGNILVVGLDVNTYLFLS